MFCPNCGEKLTEGCVFCGNCGEKLPRMQAPGDAGREKTVSSSGNPANENAFREPAQDRREDETGRSCHNAGRQDGDGKENRISGKKKVRKSGRGKAALIAGAAAAAIVLAAAALFLLFGKRPAGLISGGQEDDDGVILVTFDCGTDDSADSGIDVSDEEDVGSEENGSSGADAASGSSADFAAASEINYAPETQDVTQSGLAQCPAYPTRDGYIFGGWYTDEDCTEEFDFSTEVTEDLTLYARWLDPDSEEAQISDKEAEDFLSCLSDFSEVYEQYADAGGYVEEEDQEALLSEIEAAAEDFRLEGLITYYSAEDDTVYMEFASGLTYVFCIPEEGTDGDILDIDSSLYFPLYDTEWAYEDSAEVDAGEEEIVDVVQAFSDSTGVFRGTEISWLDGFSDMAGADVVVWHGHGGYCEELGSYLLTSETVGFWTALSDELDLYIGNTYQKLNQAICEKAITISGTGGEYVYALTAGYFRSFLPELDAAIVYLAACKSGRDSRLADAFLTRGAELVIANEGTDNIRTFYNQYMVESVFALMSGQYEEDTVCYSAGEAIDVLSALGFGSSFTADDDGNIVYENAYPNLFYADGNEDAIYYTLWGGIKGTIVPSSEGAQDVSGLTVTLIDDSTGETAASAVPDESGAFTLERLAGGSGTYTLCVQKGDDILLELEGISVSKHRYLDAGELEVEIPKRDILAELPEEFTFSSGAGAWRTMLYLEEDGSFTGTYSDSDMGVTGDGYPNGTVYLCEFYGSFSQPVQVSEHVYSMSLESLQVTTTGDPYIEDGIRYIPSDPYGMDDADEFLIFLPGAALADLPDEFLSWAYLSTEYRTTIPDGLYGLYNVGGEQGFTGRADDFFWYSSYQYDYGETWSRLCPYYNYPSSVVFWPDHDSAASMILEFIWKEDDQTVFSATDSRGSGDYEIEILLSEDKSSAQISVTSLNGTDLSAYGGTVDGTFCAEYVLTE